VALSLADLLTSVTKAETKHHGILGAIGILLISLLDSCWLKKDCIENGGLRKR
jgi:hypothetical protein